ncbi:MAG: VIT and VWA domain-containing protein, partial [Cyanobacteria bacterium]|nr:VIT and VWA domain-containing protein [Cyanobacteriota bacterium]
KKRYEAREIYQQAKAQGHVDSLLDQERSNIFTQSVANIEPGKVVEITLEYIDLLPYEDGRYTFAFPTVVGPRFNPGRATGKTGTGWSPDTTEVPDASKITPPVTPKNTRAGHDISISVDIDSGVKLENIDSKLHQVTINKDGNSHATVALQNKSTIPNKDFVLTWDIAGDELKSGYLTYRDPKSKNKSGYFTLMLVPPKRVTPDKVAPKEMIFLIDCSGSQFGAPLDKAKETLTYIIDHMNPQDTFQIIAFSSGQEVLFNKPRESTAEMKKEAQLFIDRLQAQGGTWMAPAVEKACSIPADNNRLRIVTFMTDGYVGNDMEIVGMIRKHRDRARWFPFGTGNSVNRFLIDGIAREGGGEPEYVLLNSAAGEVGKNFYKRIASPVLTDVRVKFDGLTTKEVFPKELADVWAQKPLYITGRYLAPGAGTVELTGFQQGKPYSQKLNVNFPDSNTSNEGIASVWARAKVDRLMAQDWNGAQQGQLNQELKDEIIATALEHHIMTQYTSFVAVEEKTVTKGGVSKRVTVPVEMPDGVSREGVFGEESGRANPAVRGRIMSKRKSSPGPRPMGAKNFYFAPNSPAPVAISRGSGGGSAGGISGNAFGGSSGGAGFY